MTEKKSNILSDIFKGWGKHLKMKLTSAKLSPSELTIVNERILICDSCTHKSLWNTCKKCGCYLPAKIILMNSKCPNKLWKV